jgi:RNA-directed DNA polymerase
MRWEPHVRFCERLAVRLRRATHLVAGFEHEDDARRFLDAMRARFEAFALSLHPDKTRLIEFGRHAAVRRERRGLSKPETFNFLGFTFICGKSLKGNFLLHRKSRGDRMRAKLQEIREELRQRRHQAIPLQGEWLRAVVSGYFSYHAVPTNGRAPTVFHYHVRRLWLRTLQRRSERDGSTWQRIEKLAAEWLPKPRILHPWPRERFAVRHPR